MPSYAYRAVDPRGQRVEGLEDAESHQDCLHALSAQGYRVLAIEPFREPLEEAARGRGLSAAELEAFHQHLLTAARAEAPLTESLRALEDGLNPGRLRDMLRSMRCRLEAGATLPEALAGHPASFPPFERALVKAGVESGRLEEALESLARYDAHRAELRHRVHEMLAYPCVVLVAAVAALGLLLLEVVPEFEAFYSDFGVEFPWLLRFVVALSRTVREGRWESIALTVGALAAGGGLLGLLAWLSGRVSALGRLRLRVPGLGARDRCRCTALFSRSLGLLLAGEYPLDESVRIAAETAGNPWFARRVGGAARRVNLGTPLGEALNDAGPLPQSYCWLVATADRLGNLPEALRRLADDYDAEMQGWDHLLAGLLAPALLLTTGVVVGMVVLSLYLPLYQLGTSLSL